MKHLTIIRHAKAEDPSPATRDVDRRLTARGRKDALLVGAALAQLSPPIDWLFSSTAARAQDTTTGIVQLLPLRSEPALRPQLYNATPTTLLEVATQSPHRAEHVALVAHNPGLEELIAGLCAGSPGRLYINLPPGGVVQVQLDIAQWDQLRWGSGVLSFMLRPKILRALKRLHDE